MPYTRRPKRAYRRKPRRAPRRRRRKANLSIVRTSNGLPDQLYTTLSYTQQFQLSADPGLQQFRGNGMFDPDFSGVGHQPFYFDQLAAVYDRYQVFASSIYIQFHNNQANPIYCVILPSAESTTLAASPFEAKEKPYARSTLLPAENGGGVRSLRHSMTTKRIRGEDWLDQDFAALTTTNPGRQWFWNLHTARADATTALALTAVVTLKYRCRFMKRNNDVSPS